MPASGSSLATRTTTYLLDALRDRANEPAWAHVDARFRPVVAGLARRIGLSDADAEEVAQQTLAEFVRAYREGRYDRGAGRLGSWILGMARNIALHRLRDASRASLPGATAIAAIPDESCMRAIWIDERDRVILEGAIDVLRDASGVDERTLLAFELFAMRGVPVAEVASRCGMTPEQVYVAKSRVTKRLRSLVAEMTEAFEEDA